MPASTRRLGRALEISRARRGIFQRESNRYEAVLQPDELGLGISIEACHFHGSHLGIQTGRLDFVMGVETGSPAELRGVRFLDQIVEIGGQPVSKYSAKSSPVLEGASVSLLIERYRGDALANLAWHMAITACMRHDLPMLIATDITLSHSGLACRTGRVREEDAIEFRQSDGIELVTGSHLSDVAAAFGSVEVIAWLDKEEQLGSDDGTSVASDRESERESEQESPSSRSSTTEIETLPSESSTTLRSPREHWSPREHLLSPQSSCEENTGENGGPRHSHQSSVSAGTERCRSQSSVSIRADPELEWCDDADDTSSQSAECDY